MALLGMEIHQTVMADDGDVWVEKERGKLKLYEMREWNYSLIPMSYIYLKWMSLQIEQL